MFALIGKFVDLDMPTQEEKICFGIDWKSEFKDRPTLVFFGTPTSFQTFATFLEKFAETEEGSVRFGEQVLFKRGNIEIILRLLPKATGMQLVNDTNLEWGLSSVECKHFAGILDGFKFEPIGETRWNYLDCGVLDKVNVVVVMGMGEYRKADFGLA
jgi:hypothetical protein